MHCLREHGHSDRVSERCGTRHVRGRGALFLSNLGSTVHACSVSVPGALGRLPYILRGVLGSCGVSVLFGMLGSIVGTCSGGFWSVAHIFHVSEVVCGVHVCFFSETTAQECGVFNVIGSTPVLLSSVMEKCAQAMWRFPVNIVSLLVGDSYNGSMTALVGELIATDADVILGCGLWSTSRPFPSKNCLGLS